jgi:L-glyceraldehyde 3-phosphate reductase
MEEYMYSASSQRYETMLYLRCGKSGLLLPAISLGLWHNFGGVDTLENSRSMLCRAFDLGITHFDLANNYGPPPGSAEENFGHVLKTDFAGYRDEIIISTKAGWQMWPGPYGDWGSRKYLLASLDQSLMRMGLDYVDIFYSHRPDPQTPVEETMSALYRAVQSGKALYVGISSYNIQQTAEAVRILSELGTPCLIHQPKYSMFDRTLEEGLLDLLGTGGIGCIAFCPLARGLLTNRYLDGIPADSRASKPHGFLKKTDIDERRLKQVRALDRLARQRGQTVAQTALAWVLKDGRMTSALIGASRTEQIEQNVAALGNLHFSAEELQKIDEILEWKMT